MTQDNPYAIFDYERFPIVDITFTGNEATDQNFTAYLEETNQIHKKGMYTAIVDASKPTFLASKYRIQQGNNLKENEQVIKKNAIGLALIAPSLLQRIILDAIFFVKPYPAPLKICKNREEAESWVQEQLEKAKQEGKLVSLEND